MATKGSNTKPSFGSDDKYSGGPKVGRPTKSSDFGAALATQGHVPGRDFPTASNEFNAWLNGSSLLTDWLFQGSDQKTTDANVVETDSNGKISTQSTKRRVCDAWRTNLASLSSRWPTQSANLVSP